MGHLGKKKPKRILGHSACFFSPLARIAPRLGRMVIGHGTGQQYRHWVQLRCQHGTSAGMLAGTTLLLCVALLAGCQEDLGERLQSGQVLAWHGVQGRWVGPVEPANPSCGSRTQGLLTIGEKGFGFDPFESTTVIQGEVGKDGHLSGTLARQGGEHQNLVISFEGLASESGTLSGTLQSGRCQWTVALHRG
jgi:hypothetical protein